MRGSTTIGLSEPTKSPRPDLLMQKTNALDSSHTFALLFQPKEQRAEIVPSYLNKNSGACSSYTIQHPTLRHPLFSSAWICFLSLAFSSFILVCGSLLTGMPSLAFGFITKNDSSAWMHYRGFLNDETVSFQALDVTTRIGQGNLIHFIRIQPNFTFATFQHWGSQAFL